MSSFTPSEDVKKILMGMSTTNRKRLLEMLPVSIANVIKPHVFKKSRFSANSVDFSDFMPMEEVKPKISSKLICFYNPKVEDPSDVSLLDIHFTLNSLIIPNNSGDFEAWPGSFNTFTFGVRRLLFRASEMIQMVLGVLFEDVVRLEQLNVHLYERDQEKYVTGCADYTFTRNVLFSLFWVLGEEVKKENPEKRYMIFDNGIQEVGRRVRGPNGKVIPSINLKFLCEKYWNTVKNHYHQYKSTYSKRIVLEAVQKCGKSMEDFNI